MYLILSAATAGVTAACLWLLVGLFRSEADRRALQADYTNLRNQYDRLKDEESKRRLKRVRPQEGEDSDHGVGQPAVHRRTSEA